MSDCKVVHPTAQHRVDQLHDPADWLRLVAAEHVFELPQQRRPFLEFRRVIGTPNTPTTARAAEIEWLDREFGWSEATAKRFISVHELSLKSLKLSDLELPVSALYLLAAPSIPESVCDAVLDLAANGETLTHAQVKQLLKPFTLSSGVSQGQRRMKVSHSSCWRFRSLFGNVSWL